MLQNGCELGSARLVILRRLRQQKARFQIGEPGRHHQIVGGDLEAQLALPSDKVEVLIGEGQDRDFGEIDLLFAGQREQQIDRPFVPVEVEHELLGLGNLRFHWLMACDRQHEFIQSFRWHADQPAKQIEIQPSLLSNIGKQEEKEQQDQDAIALEPRQGEGQCIGQKPDSHPSAVQRRQR